VNTARATLGSRGWALAYVCYEECNDRTHSYAGDRTPRDLDPSF